MEAASEYRRWDVLTPDALGLIFSKGSLHERVTVIPRVCKSWAKAVSGPNCWQEINLLKWSNNCQPDQLHKMVKMLIAHSSGSLRKLCVSGLKSDSIFTFIAEKNMKPCDTIDMVCEDDEPMAIASTMPNLRRLEIAYNPITTDGVRYILCGCPKLGFLDVLGCFGVEPRDIFRKQEYPKPTVMGPFVSDYYHGGNGWKEKEIASRDLLEEMAWQFKISDMIENREYPGDDGEGNMEFQECRVCWCSSDDDGEGDFEFEGSGTHWCPCP